MRILFLGIFILLTVASADAQKINYSAYLDGPNPQQFNKQQYIFIDFWASWCIPCIKSMHHIEYLQSLFQDKVFFISMSNESEYVVNKFLNNRDMKTTTLLDFKNKNFNKHNISTIPMAILMSNTGMVLWRGHPSEMTPTKMRSILPNRISSGQLSLNYMETGIANETKIKYNSIYFKSLFHTDTIKIAPSPYNLNRKSIRGNKELFFQGSLRALIAFLLEVNESQIIGSQELKKSYYIKFPLELLYKKTDLTIQKIQEHLRFTATPERKMTEALIIQCADSTTFLSRETLDFGGAKSLLSENTIEADNMSCESFAELMSTTINKKVIFKNPPSGKYDWNLHHKYENLMMEQLKYDFNTTVTEKVIEQTIYNIQFTGPEN